jgi:hypothetical protein
MDAIKFIYENGVGTVLESESKIKCTGIQWG